MKRDAELLAELEGASCGLYVMSESDYPFEIVYLKGAAEPDLACLRELAHEAADAPVETRTIEDFFRARIYYPGLQRGRAPLSAPSPEALLSLLSENLANLRVYRIGRINMAVLIIGKSPEGNWLGLSTRVVET